MPSLYIPGRALAQSLVTGPMLPVRLLLITLLKHEMMGPGIYFHAKQIDSVLTTQPINISLLEQIGRRMNRCNRFYSAITWANENG